MSCEHRYSPASLRADYVRAGVGLALSGGPLVVVASHPVATWILGGLAALFVLFGLRTALRQAVRYHVTDESIARAGVPTLGIGAARLSWSQLTKVRLRYYSTRRGRDGGWMQLILKAGRDTLRIESSLEGFDAIAAVAARAAERRGLEPDPATLNNFTALGIRFDPGDWPETAAGGR